MTSSIKERSRFVGTEASFWRLKEVDVFLLATVTGKQLKLLMGQQARMHKNILQVFNKKIKLGLTMTPMMIIMWQAKILTRKSLR